MYIIIRLYRKKQLPLHQNSSKDERVYASTQAISPAIQEVYRHVGYRKHPFSDTEYLLVCCHHPHSSDSLQDR